MCERKKKQKRKPTHKCRWVVMPEKDPYVNFDRNSHINKIHDCLNNCIKRLNSIKYYRNSVAYTFPTYILSNPEILNKLSNKQLDDLVIYCTEMVEYVKDIHSIHHASKYHNAFIKILEICGQESSVEIYKTQFLKWLFK